MNNTDALHFLEELKEILDNLQRDIRYVTHLTETLTREINKVTEVAND
jgi:hypothetical protein